MPKNGQFWASFWKPEACGQTVLPDRSILIGQKLVENAKIKKIKCDIAKFEYSCIFEFLWYYRPKIQVWKWNENTVAIWVVVLSLLLGFQTRGSRIKVRTHKKVSREIKKTHPWYSTKKILLYLRRCIPDMSWGNTDVLTRNSSCIRWMILEQENRILLFNRFFPWIWKMEYKRFT